MVYWCVPATPPSHKSTFGQRLFQTETSPSQQESYISEGWGSSNQCASREQRDTTSISELFLNILGHRAIQFSETLYTIDQLYWVYWQWSISTPPRYYHCTVIKTLTAKYTVLHQTDLLVNLKVYTPALGQKLRCQWRTFPYLPKQLRYNLNLWQIQ